MAIELLAGDRDAALTHHVATAKFNSRNANLLSGHLYDLLDDEIQLRRTESAHRAGDDIICVNAEGVAVDILDDVRPAALHRRTPRDPRRHRAIRAAVRDDAA